MATWKGSVGVLSLLLLVWGMVSLSEAWCPLTHYSFVCDATASTYGDEACVCGYSGDLDLFIGADLPDAFAGGQFFSETQCPPEAAALHDGVFAGYMVQLAKEKYPQFLNLSMGFASHVVGDAAGFYQGGFLYTPTPPNWLTMFPFMLTVDAYLYQNWSCTPMVPTTPLSEEGAEFIAQATQYYNTFSSSFPVLNSTQILACTNRWAQQVNQFYAQAVNQLPSTTSNQLLFFDPFNATTVQEAFSDVNSVYSCAVSAIQFYFTTLLSSSPENAYNTVVGYIGAIYDEGECSPQRLRSKF